LDHFLIKVNPNKTKINSYSETYHTLSIMLFRYLALAAALCATSVNGFAFSRSPAVASRSSTALNIMTAAELESIISEAEACAEGECALDQVESLIHNLLDQQKMLNQRIGEIDTLVKDLEHMNGKDNRPTDEVRNTVQAIFRIFALGVSFGLLAVTFCAENN
jgi:hypothetical protein